MRNSSAPLSRAPFIERIFVTRTWCRAHQSSSAPFAV
jgi:hypothetical protein